MAKKNRYEGDSLSGVLPLIKNEGMTSHDAVFAARKLFQTMRIGHTGTLDPMASGVLIILVGRSAKASEYILHDKKRYIAVLRLGITTDTEDITGKILTESDVPMLTDEMIESIRTKFTGKMMQVPPMYSAIKVGGKKLLDLARQGIEIEREAREITVFSLDIERGESANELILDVVCSGGTYIRTLCSDIGASIGCGGCMAALRRCENSGYTEEDCVTLDELEKMTFEQRVALLRPTEELFSDTEIVAPCDFSAHLLRSGCTVLCKKLGLHGQVGKRYRIYDSCGFFSLGEIVETEEGPALKPIKKFRLEQT